GILAYFRSLLLSSQNLIFTKLKKSPSKRKSSRDETNRTDVVSEVKFGVSVGNIIIAIPAIVMGITHSRFQRTLRCHLLRAFSLNSSICLSICCVSSLLYFLAFFFSPSASKFMAD